MRSIRIIRILISDTYKSFMHGNTRAKYLADRVRVWPTDSGLLTHVKTPCCERNAANPNTKIDRLSATKKKKRETKISDDKNSSRKFRGYIYFTRSRIHKTNHPN